MLSELDIHVTNRCTAACKYCCFSSNRMALPEMNVNELKQTIDDAVALGCSHIHFTGGEPLLREDIFDLLTYAGNLGLQMRLQTNGTLLTKKRAEKLVHSGLTSIMISLDADRPKEHDAMRGEKTWSMAVDAIKIARDAGMKVRVNSVLTKQNWRRIPETIHFVHSLGIRMYSAFYFSPIGCGADAWDAWIEPETYLTYWKELKAELQSDPKLADMDLVIEKGYVSWQEAHQIDISEFTGCGGGCQHTYAKRDYLIVRCDGNVYPCIMSIDSKPLGNLHQTTLGEIYRCSSHWENLKPSIDPYCHGCTHYTLCNEGCRYYPQPLTGHDIRCIKGKLVPLCPIMKYNTRNDSFGGSSDDVIMEEI